MAALIIPFTAGAAFVPAQPKMVASSGLGPTIGATVGATVAASAATLLGDPSATSNSLFFSEPVGVCVFACAVSGVFLHFSQKVEAPGIDEACVVQDEAVCGRMSFDSVCTIPGWKIENPCSWWPCACLSSTIASSLLLADGRYGVRRATGRGWQADLGLRIGTMTTGDHAWMQQHVTAALFRSLPVIVCV